ncbi:MAG TPA: phage major capsid protein [Chloroflexota bacterium]|nr:phage major capsid protein [Chloroflexota bacterium]
MSVKSLELRKQRAKIAADMAALIPKEGKMSPESRVKFDALDAEQKGLLDQVEVIERAEALELELRDTTRPPEDDLGGDAEKRQKQTEEKRKAAFADYLRNGLSESAHFRGMSPENRKILMEQRDMGVIGTTTAGGYFVPQGFVYDVEQAMKWYGSMLDAGTIMDTATGQPLPWPSDNDTTVVGEQISENTQVTAADVTLGSLTFNAWKYSTKLVKVSIEMLQDSAFPIESYIKDKFAIRLGRILNTHFTTGGGTTLPNGIVTAAAAGPTAVGAAGNTGGSDSATNTIGSTDIFELEHSVDRAYRNGAAYMMHDTTLKTVKDVLDKYGRPLWKPSLSSGDPDTFNGYPFFINNDMATPAASAKTMLFGQLKKYMIRRVKGLAVLRLDERFADYGQVAFIGFARYDGNLLDAGTHPVKYLIQHS